MASRSGDGQGEAGGAGLVISVSDTGEGVPGESLAAPEHAAVRMIDVKRADTARIKTKMSITSLKLYQSFRRQRGPYVMLIH